MKIYELLICLLTTVLIMIVIFLFVKELQQVHHNKAMLNEYEYVLADVWAEKERIWAEKEDCKDQLGVFYKE